MGSRQKRDEWLQGIDIRERQRNVVFPDTAKNEARFWRNLLETKQRLSTVQKIGLAVMALVAVGVVVTFSRLLYWAIAFAIIGAFLAAFSLSTRQTKSRNTRAQD